MVALRGVMLLLVMQGCGNGGAVEATRSVPAESQGAEREPEPTSAEVAPAQETDREPLPSAARLNAALEATRGERPCGAYVNAGSLWEVIHFGDGHVAYVLLSADSEPSPERARAWLPLPDGRIAVRNDRGFFLFERVDDRTLRGVDGWTNGETWVRSDETPSCGPVGETAEERRAFSHELCELDGYMLRTNGDVPGALALHERCCDSGAAASCSRAGQILEIVRRDQEAAERRYRSSCEGNHPRGCYDLAQLLQRTGRSDEARRFYAHACDMGSIDACTEQLEMDAAP